MAGGLEFGASIRIARGTKSQLRDDRTRPSVVRIEFASGRARQERFIERGHYTVKCSKLRRAQVLPSVSLSVAVIASSGSRGDERLT